MVNEENQSQPPSKSQNGSKKLKNDEEGVYGILDNRNIARVTFGKYEFDTWYGNAAYFNPQDPLHEELGISFSNSSTLPTGRIKKKKKKIDSPLSQSEKPEKSFWVDKLHVCEYCFKYTTDFSSIQLHRQSCNLKSKYPSIGKLVYRDLQSPYIIKKIRGFKHQLFCQNLSLFSKLFLDDKSVYYNVSYFDFYVIYGFDALDEEKLKSGPTPFFKPMGFFSKEVISWDNNNNLACICIFPPYQRLHIGSLLIEFSYALASLTPGQSRSGPEFPLSPYGKITYLKFWSKKLSYILVSNFENAQHVKLKNLADLSGFRKEDVLLTLQFMNVLIVSPDSNEINLAIPQLKHWCEKNGIDPLQNKELLNADFLVI